MKTRSKLLLAAVSLLTVSVAATATSAYAWYTANRHVEAKVNSLGVHSSTGSLNIVHDTSINQTNKTTNGIKESSTENSKSLVYTTDSILTDVSSTGDGTFIKPKWDATGKADAANCVGTYGQEGDAPNKKVTLYGSGEKATKAYGVVSLGVKFTNDGDAGSDDMYLYLDPTVTVEADPSSTKMSSDSVVNSARFSICEVDDTTGAVKSVKLYGNPKSGVTVAGEEGKTKEVNQYVSAASAKSVTLSNIETAKVVDQGNLIGTSNRVTDPTAKENQELSKGFLCKISATNSVRYLITMWVEGTDDDCKFSASGDDSFMVEGLSIGLGFYALTAAPTQNQTPGA